MCVWCYLGSLMGDSALIRLVSLAIGGSERIEAATELSFAFSLVNFLNLLNSAMESSFQNNSKD